MTDYKPEGYQEKQEVFSRQALESALVNGKILEAKAILCDKERNLMVQLGTMKGIIPKEEVAWSPQELPVRDIAVITRVGKTVAFKVTGFTADPSGAPLALLSRKAAQKQCYEQWIRKLSPGDILLARITHMEQFGCFVDLGCGIVSMISIDNISTSRIAHPRDRFVLGQVIRVVMKGLEPDGKIVLTHKELLGTWEENVSAYEIGQTAAGIIRSIEPYGIFVELTPNLAGLAEYREDVEVGQTACVYIKNIIPEKMKVKLLIIDAFQGPAAHLTDSDYYVTSGKIAYWRYTPLGCEKTIESLFV